MTAYLAFGTATPTGGSFAFGGGNGDKFTNTLTIVPSFEYRRGNLTIGRLFHLVALAQRLRQSRARHGGEQSREQPYWRWFHRHAFELENADWKIAQTGGPDWTDLSLQKNPRISDDNRQNTIDIKPGDLNSKYVLPVCCQPFIQCRSQEDPGSPDGDGHENL